MTTAIKEKAAKARAKARAAWRSLTIKWNAAVGALGGVYFALQDAVPELKMVLNTKALAAFVVANALIGFWLRQRTTQPLSDYADEPAQGGRDV